MKKIFLPLIAASVLLNGADLDALQKECDGGKGASCYELGVLYDNAREGAAQDYQKAAELYSKACNLGNGAGCFIRQRKRRGAGRQKSRPALRKGVRYGR